MPPLSQMHSMILAAGLGQRMRPLTQHCPKPLIKVGGRRLIDYAFDTLRESGVCRTVVNTHYLAEQMDDYLDDVSGLKIQRSAEPELLETGGGIAAALPLLGDAAFFALNSDTICIAAPKSPPVLVLLAEQWDDASMDALLLLVPRHRAHGYLGHGDFVCDETKRRYRRRVENEQGDFVFTGVQLLHPRLFDGCPPGAFSMNVLYDRHQFDNGWFDRVGFAVHQGDWLHVGDALGLDEANVYFSHSKLSLLS